MKILYKYKAGEYFRTIPKIQFLNLLKIGIQIF